MHWQVREMRWWPVTTLVSKTPTLFFWFTTPHATPLWNAHVLFCLLRIWSGRLDTVLRWLQGHAAVLHFYYAQQLVLHFETNTSVVLYLVLSRLLFIHSVLAIPFNSSSSLFLLEPADARTEVCLWRLTCVCSCRAYQPTRKPPGLCRLCT